MKRGANSLPSSWCSKTWSVFHSLRLRGPVIKRFLLCKLSRRMKIKFPKAIDDNMEIVNNHWTLCKQRSLFSPLLTGFIRVTRESKAKASSKDIRWKAFWLKTRCRACVQSRSHRRIQQHARAKRTFFPISFGKHNTIKQCALINCVRVGGLGLGATFDIGELYVRLSG